MAESNTEKASPVTTGKAPNGVEVEVFNEGGLMVVRDKKGDRLTHSDTIEGLEGAGFKLKPVKKASEEKEPAKK